ncbi:MAG: 3-dehydroquinate synthase [Pseudobdellovibrionaceae bacterium]|nr:3-dehydroquinate synthase [Bdellovibrionales bacterium]USN46565.1 MAG: 3-dehydroquinate synthase [Pseudobdellovibrionaceae bacterium]
MTNKFQTPVFFQHKLPLLSEIKSLPSMRTVDDLVLVYDRKLEKLNPFKLWKEQFSTRYPVNAGEELKSLSEFSEHMNKLSELTKGCSPRRLGVIAVGGTSVGDFAGFVASVLKRGVNLVHIPTTWGAALDSAIVGNTSLNVGSLKNHIGTFYPANGVYIVSLLLSSAPPKNVASASVEVMKMGLVAGGALFEKLGRSTLEGVHLLWDCIPDVVAAKQAVVGEDPFDTNGKRQLLNLGHTFGHVVEDYFNWSHGVSVGFGIRFMLEWSVQRGFMHETKKSEILKIAERLWPKEINEKHKAMPKKELIARLILDKKSEGEGSIHFIFMRSPGELMREQVKILNLVDEAHRQGWVK